MQVNIAVENVQNDGYVADEIEVGSPSGSVNAGNAYVSVAPVIIVWSKSGVTNEGT